MHSKQKPEKKRSEQEEETNKLVDFVKRIFEAIEKYNYDDEYWTHD